MISAIAFLVLSGSLAPEMMSFSTLNLPDLFAAACLDSNLRMPADEGTDVGFEGLPRELRERLGKPSAAKVWHLNHAGDAYLYTLNYEGGQKENPRVCGVASDAMNIAAARKVVSLRLTGQADGNELANEWLGPKAGYRAVVTKVGKFKVAQVNWLSDKQRAAMIKEYSIVQ